MKKYTLLILLVFMSAVLYAQHPGVYDYYVASATCLFVDTDFTDTEAAIKEECKNWDVRELVELSRLENSLLEIARDELPVWPSLGSLWCVGFYKYHQKDVYIFFIYIHDGALETVWAYKGVRK